MDAKLVSYTINTATSTVHITVKLPCGLCREKAFILTQSFTDLYAAIAPNEGPVKVFKFVGPSSFDTLLVIYCYAKSMKEFEILSSFD